MIASITRLTDDTDDLDDTHSVHRLLVACLLDEDLGSKAASNFSDPWKRVHESFACWWEKVVLLGAIEDSKAPKE